MDDVEISTEEEIHHRNHVNTEEGNLREGEIWVDLNDSKKTTQMSYNKLINK